MPFLLDLLTLLMEAGSSFLHAMTQAVEEFRGHPVAEEFGRVLADMNLGKTRMEAFQAMRKRLADDEITSIIGSILQGETWARRWRGSFARKPMCCASGGRNAPKWRPARRASTCSCPASSSWRPRCSSSSARSCSIF